MGDSELDSEVGLGADLTLRFFGQLDWSSYLMNTGFLLPGFPCMGAWLSYGLGRLTDNLPTFVVLPDPRGLPARGGAGPRGLRVGDAGRGGRGGSPRR